ncbi:hypothetical protein FY115_00720 [Cellvibrio japonicus]|nr:hypothetical protein FY117_00720 [Cellvibrio japonicus]QEI14471.1 hypothetical protein FY116_00720 [Cellvibrio japonicus]QEI18049.1 hypothetical protein FY115_00720 [Cellvibrio japonicus]
MNHTDDILITIKPVTDSISIAILGLGNEILVTNEPTISVAGIASADAPINKISFNNPSSAISGDAAGIENWSVSVPLAIGDNPLTFTAQAADGKTAEINTTITYYPNLAFNTPLILSQDIAYKNETVNLSVTIGLSTGTEPTVTLFTASEDGTPGSELEPMLDDGKLPDEIEKDGIYSTQFAITPTSTGYQCYRAKIEINDSTPYFSELRCMWVTSHYTAEEVATATSVADDLESAYLTLLANGKTEIEAANTVVSSLSTNIDIGEAGATGDGGIWWVTKAGILGAYHPVLENQRAAAAKQRNATPRKQNPISTKKPVVPTVAYPATYLAHRNYYVPSAPAQPTSKYNLRTKTAGENNPILSNKALIISPYLNNPIDPQNSFGSSDDYFGVWNSIKNGNQCLLYAEKEAVNNGSLNVSLSDFYNLSSFGYIHIVTHGDNFYNGLLSLWQNNWGPNNFLTGSLSQVVIYSGLYLPSDGNGGYDITGYEDDLQAKRLVIAPGGAIAILPSYFQRYVGALPNSLVILGACRSTYNNSLANVFLSKGAGAVVGYTDYVNSSYAQNTLKMLVEEMYTGKDVGEAINATTAIYGTNDADNDPAYITLSGASNLSFGSGNFSNLGFEDGTLTTWERSGDGRVISQLGSTRPTEGVWAGIISTGLGYTTTAGQIEQTGCLANNVTKLNFDWNFFSEEFLEYCESIYQDEFKVDICEKDNSVTTNCQTLFQTNIDQLCNSVSASDVSFDQGGVYNTGWSRKSLNIDSYAGKNVLLRFYATDIGDSIYDSAILLDNIEIE